MKRLEGIVHTHTTSSFDGKLDYPELRTFLLGKGLKFACITEHIEGLEQDNIDTIISLCRQNSDDQFLFIPGIEMDCFCIYFLGIDTVVVNFENNQTIFDSLKTVAQLLVISHPIKKRFKFPDWLKETCNAVEVINTKHDGIHYLRPQSMKVLNSIREKRPEVVALAGMDFHSKKNYTPVRIRLDENIPLSEKAILEAIRANHFAIVKDGRPFSEYNLWERSIAQLRIHIMDFSHDTHLFLSRKGFKIPKGIKSLLRRIMEGQ